MSATVRNRATVISLPRRHPITLCSTCTLFIDDSDLGGRKSCATTKIQKRKD